MYITSKQSKFENFMVTFRRVATFGGTGGVITFGTLRYVPLLYGTFRCITIIFNAFSLVFTVENNKQREQDCIGDESQHSEKPSRVVDRSFFNFPRTWKKKKKNIDSDGKKPRKNSLLRYKNNKKVISMTAFKLKNPL